MIRTYAAQTALAVASAAVLVALMSSQGGPGLPGPDSFLAGALPVATPALPAPQASNAA